MKSREVVTARKKIAFIQNVRMLKQKSLYNKENLLYNETNVCIMS